METVTISLNGRVVAGTPGTTILDLARQVGVEIPTLCYHPLLESSGVCRLCLVEEGKTGRLLTSCVTPIADGMEVLTHSANVVSARRGRVGSLILSLILQRALSATRELNARSGPWQGSTGCATPIWSPSGAGDIWRSSILLLSGI